MKYSTKQRLLRKLESRRGSRSATKHRDDGCVELDGVMLRESQIRTYHRQPWTSCVEVFAAVLSRFFTCVYDKTVDIQSNKIVASETILRVVSMQTTFFENAFKILVMIEPFFTGVNTKGWEGDRITSACISVFDSNPFKFQFCKCHPVEPNIKRSIFKKAYSLQKFIVLQLIIAFELTMHAIHPCLNKPIGDVGSAEDIEEAGLALQNQFKACVGLILKHYNTNK